jgi:dihydrofolate reductase
MQRTGAYVIGANTYQEMLGMTAAAGGDATPTYVVTHRTDWPNAPAHVRFVSGGLRALFVDIKAQTDKDLWVFGGGDLVTQCLALDLLDELSLAIVPVLLGGGLPLFRPLPAPINLRLTEAKPYKSGIVLLKYVRGSAPARP